MPDIVRAARRHKLLFAVGLLVIVALVAIIFYMPRGGEKMVANGTFSVSDNSVSDTFGYNGSSVNQSMALGCSLPASMKIICQSLTRTGNITVYINDEGYATGIVSDAGDVMLSSGCGCSTVCICEIKVGQNIIKISSSGFAGQLKYEIYVKS
jgi:hypothetical protein